MSGRDNVNRSTSKESQGRNQLKVTKQSSHISELMEEETSQISNSHFSRLIEEEAAKIGTVSVQSITHKLLTIESSNNTGV